MDCCMRAGGATDCVTRSVVRPATPTVEEAGVRITACAAELAACTRPATQASAALGSSLPIPVFWSCTAEPATQDGGVGVLGGVPSPLLSLTLWSCTVHPVITASSAAASPDAPALAAPHFCCTGALVGQMSRWLKLLFPAAPCVSAAGSLARKCRVLPCHHSECRCSTNCESTYSTALVCA